MEDEVLKYTGRVGRGTAAQGSLLGGQAPPGGAQACWHLWSSCPGRAENVDSRGQRGQPIAVAASSPCLGPRAPQGHQCTRGQGQCYALTCRYATGTPIAPWTILLGPCMIPVLPSPPIPPSRGMSSCRGTSVPEEPGVDPASQRALISPLRVSAVQCSSSVPGQSSAAAQGLVGQCRNLRDARLTAKALTRGASQQWPWTRLRQDQNGAHMPGPLVVDQP